MTQTIHEPMTLGDTYAPPPTVAELHELRKVYYKPDGSVLVEALRGVNISIPRGQYVAIMGPSGSGKSTLMNILGCLDQPTSGRYLLDGRDVSTLNDEELSSYRGKKIGFVFQAFNLIPQLKIEENVEVPLFYQSIHKHERARRAREKLELVGLQDRIGHRPSELSGGQQQRAAIARALVTDPVVLMADEPTGNLDSATGQAVLGVLEKLHQEGMTLMIVTHDERIASRCQRVIRLRDGLVETDVLRA
ncbi:MAG TPA: ABC transporter ATP-binding protein [Phycisphaerales bacterium]|nr:ABC transporter ATP-binding protein [Phycisphaerales bacterium]